MRYPVTEPLPQRNTIYEADCLRRLQTFPDNCVTAVVTDPPYGLSKQPDMREVLKHWLRGDDYVHTGSGFMGKSWDSFVPGPKVWEEVYRVLKPGGHVLSFGGTRTYDLMTMAMRLASLEIRDKIDFNLDVNGYKSWVYGSGFPKSLNISKAIEKLGSGDAKTWDGYGTALKPAHEPIIHVGEGEHTNADIKYETKASKKDRNYGCKWMYWKTVGGVLVLIDKKEHEVLEAENESRKDEAGYQLHRLSSGNIHPTVKPLSLCRYLVKMVKMPGDNLILDPFCGSGSILCGAVLEGCDFVGIDADPMSVQIARARTHYFKCLGEKGVK